MSAYASARVRAWFVEGVENILKNQCYRMCVAPMMDWTDRHCRYFHRGLSARARLYTEMVTADAVLHGDRAYLLGHDVCEQPLAAQLGGSQPDKLAAAARILEDFGYAEINLNVGCPSDRVRSGAFGACLMKEPDRVAACVAQMRAAVDIPVTVKCRIGVDDQDPSETLPGFMDTVAAAGCDVFIVHARKAWLEGLSPKDNRTIPPLDYDLVADVKAARPELTVVLNGGLADLESCAVELERFDGVMLGRAAYETPYVLADVDVRLFGDAAAPVSRHTAAERMIPYIERHVAAGGRPHSVTRHMLGLFHGEPGARAWRRILSTEASKPGADAGVLAKALAVFADGREAAA
ncbi:MAG: tRNA dihydrouridine(20/20a) synthase DusA [Pseudomonadota bacterium]